MFEHTSEWLDMKFSVDDSSISGWTGGSATAGYTESVDISTYGTDGNAVNFLVAGMIVKILDSTETTVKGHAVVTDVESGNLGCSLKSLTKGATASAAGLIDLADDDVVYVISNAHEEGSGSPEAWFDEIETVWNSAQIMKTPVEITGTLYETSLLGYNDELARLRREKMAEHKMLKNKHFLLGVRGGGLGAPDHIVGSAGLPIRTTMGIIPALEDYGDTDNLFTVNAATDGYNEFNAQFEKLFQYVNEKGVKYAFCSPKVITYFSGTDGNSLIGNTSTGSYDITSGMSKFGFPVKMIETGHGDLVVAKDVTLRGTAHQKYMVAVDPKNIEHKVFRTPKYQTAIQDNDVDGIKDQFFSDEGMGISLIKSHALWTFSNLV